jgi:hypothetical protein
LTDAAGRTPAAPAAAIWRGDEASAGACAANRRVSTGSATAALDALDAALVAAARALEPLTTEIAPAHRSRPNCPRSS